MRFAEAMNALSKGISVVTPWGRILTSTNELFDGEQDDYYSKDAENGEWSFNNVGTVSVADVMQMEKEGKDVKQIALLEMQLNTVEDYNYARNLLGNKSFTKIIIALYDVGRVDRAMLFKSLEQKHWEQ